jgi:hypothetical protein
VTVARVRASYMRADFAYVPPVRACMPCVVVCECVCECVCVLFASVRARAMSVTKVVCGRALRTQMSASCASADARGKAPHQ